MSPNATTTPTTMNTSSTQQTPVTSSTDETDIEAGKTNSIANTTPIDGIKDKDDYVVYVRPKDIKVLPPAKYKLFLITFVGVWFAEWVASLAGMYPAIQKALRLSHNGTMFFLLGTIVAVLVFGTVELMIKYIKIKIGSTVYGIGPWLKQPRVKWVHEYNNIFAQSCNVIIHILENGFDLFSTPPPPPSPSSSKKTDTSSSSSAGGKQFQCAKPEDVHQDVVLRIVSHVQQTKIDDYKKWVHDFQSMGCLARPGMKHVYTNFKDDPADGVYVWYMTFSNIDYLNDFMTSPVHDRMVRQLQPLLVTKTLYQLTNERDLPDAFTDIVTPQSQSVPTLLPKKWKVWTITTLSLWFTNMIGDATLRGHYYDEWGMNEAHPRARSTLSVLFNVFFNVYVMVPFMTLLFGYWMKRKPDEQTTLEPWRTFNDGFKSDWTKLFITVCYYGGCLIGYAVHTLR